MHRGRGQQQSASMGTSPVPVILISGSDKHLRTDAVHDAVAEMSVGSSTGRGVLQEFSGDDWPVEALVEAAMVPPLLDPFRVVCGRDMSRFGAKGLEPLIRWLADPSTTARIVLEWDSGKIPKKLTDAVSGCGGEHRKTGAGSRPRDVSGWIEKELSDSGLSLGRDAVRTVGDWYSDNPSRVRGLVSILLTVYGPGARLTAADIEPYLGQAGDVPPWDLTDAIDRGDMKTALGVLQRMWVAGRHPLQVMAIVHNHMDRIARLDGSGATDEKSAARVLGLKGSTFPAKKALAACRKRGSANIAQAYEWMMKADSDMRGRSGLDARYTAEVLCGRLAFSADGRPRR